MTRLLPDLLTQQAERHPQRLAVVGGGDVRLTYQELEESSSRIAGTLVERGVLPGSRVCLLLPKDPTAVVAILGVLKAGACYVPLDPDSPPPRLQRMLDSCDDRWLLSTRANRGLVRELTSTQPSSGDWVVGWLDEPEPVDAVSFSQADVSAARPLTDPIRQDPGSDAYIMFTSGSTGVPKGVRITHANVLAFIDWAVDYFTMAADDRNSAHPPLHFDLSVLDIFGTLAAGAELHLVPKRLNLLAPSLAAFIRDSGLTQWFSVPSVLNFMMNADCVSSGDFPSLRRLIWCGEVLPTPTLQYFMERLPHVTFTNLYGPTEATIASSFYSVPSSDVEQLDDIPIGAACPGEELLVLNEDLAPVPTGEVGDLYLAGVGLSPGYWRDPEKTGEVFLEIADRSGPPKRIYRTGDLAWVDDDGLVHFVGRADSQIKSRGYRIELGEIEAALHSLGTLEEVAVVAIRSEGFEGWTICCAYVSGEAGGPDVSKVVASLRELVPSYMLPQRWLEYDSLPKNRNGKTDRPRLRADFQARSGAEA